jgi:biotin carboxyl carrier protein
MTYAIDVGGRTRHVGIRRAGDRFEVTLDGHRLLVDLARTNSGWSLLIGPVDAGSAADGNAEADVRRPMRSYDVAVEERGGSTTVYVNGHPIPVTIGGAAGRAGRQAPSAEQGSNGPRRIVAPMPGRIVKVLVKPGQAVAARQGLVVVEAMKMENELRAPGPGTVTDVKVAEGASVEANAVLVVIS